MGELGMKNKTLIQTGYIADAIIETKKKKFNDEFTTVEEVSIITKILEQQFLKKQLSVGIVDTYFDVYFEISNGVITKIDKETDSLKQCIIGKNKEETIEIQNIVYDEELIYLCLCEIMLSKLNNSVVHSCKNCNTHCCGELNNEQAKECSRWTHDFNISEYIYKIESNTKVLSKKINKNC